MHRLIGVFGVTCGLTLGSLANAGPDIRYQSATGTEVQTLEMFQDCDTCPEMIVLPMGQFVMGSSVAEAIDARRRFYSNRNINPAPFEEHLRQAFIKIGVDPDHPEQGLLRLYAMGALSREDDPHYYANSFLHEAPAHRVVIDRPIAMGRNEVTREEWAACVADGGCQPREEMTPDERLRFRLSEGPYPNHPRQPVMAVTFEEAQDYTAWLNRKIGADAYRIPSEAEWEYAARAGTATPFAQGGSPSLKQANFFVSRRDMVDGKYVWTYSRGISGVVVPVDSLDAANGWGLRHMAGNAMEITSTCGEGPHRGLASSSAYLAADADSQDCKRSLKGGSFASNVEAARPARRVTTDGDVWSFGVGFRVVRDLTPAP